jgi:hypothetical protein
MCRERMGPNDKFSFRVLAPLCVHAGGQRKREKLHIFRVRSDVCPPVMTHFYVVCALCYQKSINSGPETLVRALPAANLFHIKDPAAATAWPPLTPKMPSIEMHGLNPACNATTLWMDGRTTFFPTHDSALLFSGLYVLHRLA